MSPSFTAKKSGVQPVDWREVGVDELMLSGEIPTNGKKGDFCDTNHTQYR